MQEARIKKPESRSQNQEARIKKPESRIAMTRTEKANDILRILDKYYPNAEPPLLHKDAYSLLVSVVLSAQCTDERVNKITPLLFSQADNPFDMIKFSIP